MTYRVEAWTFECEEDPGEPRLEISDTFEDIESAQRWTWERMEEGFQTRMYRENT